MQKPMWLTFTIWYFMAMYAEVAFPFTVISTFVNEGGVCRKAWDSSSHTTLVPWIKRNGEKWYSYGSISGKLIFWLTRKMYRVPSWLCAFQRNSTIEPNEREGEAVPEPLQNNAGHSLARATSSIWTWRTISKRELRLWSFCLYIYHIGCRFWLYTCWICINIASRF